MPASFLSSQDQRTQADHQIQLALPSSQPSPVAHPDILARILRNADKSSLAICMRISKQWYDLSAPLLYRHIDCDASVTLGEIFLGLDIEDKSEPAAKEVAQEGTSPREMLSKVLDSMDITGGPRNLKKALLSHTTSLRLNLESCYDETTLIHRLIRLSRLETIAVDVADQCVCDQLAQLSSTEHTCTENMRSESVNKVVFHGLAGPCCKPADGISALTAILPDPHELALIIPSDVSSIPEGTVEDIWRYTIIVAANVRVILDSRHSIPSSAPPMASAGWVKSVVKFLLLLGSEWEEDMNLTVYFMDDLPSAKDDRTFLTPEQCRDLVEKRFRKKEVKPSKREPCWPEVRFWTRQDYLAEEVGDELTEEQLDWHREAEHKAQEAKRLAQSDKAEGNEGDAGSGIDEGDAESEESEESESSGEEDEEDEGDDWEDEEDFEEDQEDVEEAEDVQAGADE